MMVLVLLLGLAALVSAVPVLFAGALRAASAGGDRRSALRYLGADGAPRVVAPRSAVRSLARVGERITPVSRIGTMRRFLVQAGVDLSLEHLLAAKAAGTLAGLFVGVWLVPVSGGGALLFGALLAAALWIFPDVWIRRRAEARTAAIRRSLSDSLDLLAISVEAGAGFEGAVARVAEDLGGPLGDEYRRMLREMQLGTSRREALLAMKDRVDAPEMSSFVLALLQADALGMSIGRILRTQAQEMRAARRRLARERAAKTPVKILFPLVFGIFPALLIVVLGPAAIRIMESLTG